MFSVPVLNYTDFDFNLEFCRYVGKDYSAAQELMEDEMKDYYSQNLSALPIHSLKVGQIVAVSAEEDAWLRAKIIAVEGSRIKVSVPCFFIKYNTVKMRC